MNVVVRAGAGKESADHSTDIVYGEDNPGRWVSWSTNAKFNIEHSRTEHRHTFSEVGAVGKAFCVCPHSIDTDPESEGRGA